MINPGIAVAKNSLNTNRLGVSTISFRREPLEEAVARVADLGVSEIEFGAIPGFVDHVPLPFEGDPAIYAALLERHGLRAGGINTDFGGLDEPALTVSELTGRAKGIVDLCAALGAALVIPCAHSSWETLEDEATSLQRIADNLESLAKFASKSDVRVMVEMIHYGRWIHTADRAERLLSLSPAGTYGLVMDVSHYVASKVDPVAWAREFAYHVERVHLRDAVPGDLHLGIGRGETNFERIIATLESSGYLGSYILELETHDIAESERQADARRSRDIIVPIILRNSASATGL